MDKEAENIKELAKKLLESGAATSETIALEKARNIIKASEIINKSNPQIDNTETRRNQDRSSEDDEERINEEE